MFLVVLAGIDAAYSGDWSRTGVISKEFEDSLKPLVIALGVFHIGCATVAGRSAASKNLNVVPAVLKVGAFVLNSNRLLQKGYTISWLEAMSGVHACCRYWRLAFWLW